MARVIKWGTALALILLVAGYGYISFLIASGVTKAERKDQEDTPAAHGLAFEDVEFASRRGDVTLRGWYIASEKDKATVVFVHGISATRSSDKAVDLASRLVKRGFNVLLFDLRAHGSSSSDRISGGYFERLDALGAFDFLVKRGVPPKKIGLLDTSMGAGIALLAAAEEPGIQALVADSPFADASDLIAQETARKTIFPEWLVPVFIPSAKVMARGLYGIDVGALVHERAARALSYPILVIHGLADTRIPLEHGIRVYSAAPQGSDLWLLPRVEHADAFEDNPDEYEERVAAYFEKRLGSQ